MNYFAYKYKRNKKMYLYPTFNLTSFPYQQYKKISVTMANMCNPNCTIFASCMVNRYNITHIPNVLIINWTVIVNMNFRFTIQAKL